MLTLSPSILPAFSIVLQGILRYTQNGLQKSISKNAKFNEIVELPLSKLWATSCPFGRWCLGIGMLPKEQWYMSAHQFHLFAGDAGRVSWKDLVQIKIVSKYIVHVNLCPTKVLVLPLWLTMANATTAFRKVRWSYSLFVLTPEYQV